MPKSPKPESIFEPVEPTEPPVDTPADTITRDDIVPGSSDEPPLPADETAPSDAGTPTGEESPVEPELAGEPPAGTPLTAEEREANGLPPEDAAEASEGGDTPAEEAPPEITPIEDQLTLHPDGEDGPTSDNGLPDGFVVGDQTAAGALTPRGGRHPGRASNFPGISPNVLDPHNVNGTQRNHELNEMGRGIKHPSVDEERGLPDVGEVTDV